MDLRAARAEAQIERLEHILDRLALIAAAHNDIAERIEQSNRRLERVRESLGIGKMKLDALWAKSGACPQIRPGASPAP